MGTWVALLRAVNLGSTNRVAMPALRDALRDNGFVDPRSYVASGNLVLGSRRTSAVKVTEAVAATVEQVAGTPIDVIVRSAARWRALVTANPFPEAAAQRPTLLHAYVLAGQPTGDLDAVRGRLTGDERLELVDDVLYVDHTAGVRGSKLSGPALTSALGVVLTARNWRTVLAIEAML